MLKPTGDDSLSERAQKKRRSDTFGVWLHGGSRKNVTPVVSGVVDLLTKILKTSIVASHLLNQQRLRNTFFYASKENELLGKRKYISIRKT